MPARRDIYTGRYEFLERGWGPLEDDDHDLPRQLSGPSGDAVCNVVRRGDRVSFLISDHYHLWERGAGNYHASYTGFDFVRGMLLDRMQTDPVDDFFCPVEDRDSPLRRHWENVHHLRQKEEDHFAAQVFRRAADWLQDNDRHQDFFLHIDCFTPHEPWDPPEEMLKRFWPAGYDVDFDWGGASAYRPWRERYTRQQMEFARARYAAHVMLMDKWLGVLLDQLDRTNLWDDTLVIFTSDHGTYNGDHGRMGKMQTHQHDAVGHIPMIICHPEHGQGQRRDQLVQLVDLYPTVLAATDKPLPDMPEERPLHGVNLLPVLADPSVHTHEYAIAGQFGKSVTITDGRWILHQSPPDPSPEGNQPLYWYSYHQSKFIPCTLGPFEDGRRRVLDYPSWPAPTWLSDKRDDPNELINLVESRPAERERMQAALRQALHHLRAPAEQAERLGLYSE